MKIKILSERDNPLLGRKEVKFEVTFEGGMKSMREFRKEVIATLKSKEDLTVLDGLRTRFGEKRAEGYAKIYKDKKALEVEPGFRIKKNFEEKKKKKAEEGVKEEVKEAPKEGVKKPEESKEAKPQAAPKKEDKPEEAKEVPKEEIAKPQEKPKEEVKEAPKPEKKEEVKDG